MTAVSVLILTLNEEANVGDCIDSCAWSDDIVVFDSLSSDRTREIAMQMGARVIERPFDNYAAQRNAALADVPYRHAWVLMVDADERVPPELAIEIEAAVRDAGDAQAMFRVRRKDFFLGRWLRRSSGYPTWFGRLMRLGRVRVERSVNEEYIADGEVGHLQGHLHHHPFNRGIAYWFERHNRYSTMEAVVMATVPAAPIEWRAAVGRDPAARRRALKQVYYRLPGRPLFIFVYLYVLRLGMLDGLGGLYFSGMRSIYEFLIDLKVMELKRRGGNRPV